MTRSALSRFSDRAQAQTPANVRWEGGRALRDELRELFARFSREGAVEMAMNAYVLAADVA